jgi:hypothetical protein
MKSRKVMRVVLGLLLCFPVMYLDESVPFMCIEEVNISRAKAKIKEFKKMTREYTLGVDYSIRFDGHGTGAWLPTKEKWDKLTGRITVVDPVRLSETCSRVLAFMRHSANNWFPPINNQNEEFLCTCSVQEEIL